MGLAMTASSA